MEYQKMPDGKTVTMSREEIECILRHHVREQHNIKVKAVKWEIASRGYVPPSHDTIYRYEEVTGVTFEI